MKEVQSQIQDLEAEVEEQRLWAEDSEGRSRRNNVRFIGLPEHSEGQNMELFLEEWLMVYPGR